MLVEEVCVMAVTQRTVPQTEDKPAFQINIVELHLNVGFPFLLFGPIVEGSRAVERGLKSLFTQTEPGPASLAKKDAVA
jgi:hypothetical protein